MCNLLPIVLQQVHSIILESIKQFKQFNIDPDCFFTNNILKVPDNPFAFHEFIEKIAMIYY